MNETPVVNREQLLSLETPERNKSCLVCAYRHHEKIEGKECWILIYTTGMIADAYKKFVRIISCDGLCGYHPFNIIINIIITSSLLSYLTYSVSKLQFHMASALTIDEGKVMIKNQIINATSDTIYIIM